MVKSKMRIQKMKKYVRFEENGHVSMVGMNNLIIIEDARIKTQRGLHAKIADLVKKYHKYRIDKPYHVYDYNDNLLCTGIVTL
jgi:hypothetical protein